MGRMLGSDPDQLDSLGDLLSKSADRLNAIGGEVNSLLTYTGWEGGDAEDFRWQWHHQLTGILHTTAVQSQEAARVLRVNAAEQRSASADYGAGFPGLMPSPAWTSAPPGTDAEPWWHPGLDFVLDVAGLAGFMVAGSEMMSMARDTLKGPGLLASLAVRSGSMASKLLPGGVSLGIDGAKFIDGLLGHRNDPDTVNAGVDVGLDLVEMGLLAGSVACPPLLGFYVATKIVHFGFDAVTAVDPTLPTRIADGMSDFVADTVEDTVDAIGDASEAVGGVISGGVNAVGRFLGF